VLDDLDEIAGPDLDAARGKIEAVCDALQAVLDVVIEHDSRSQVFLELRVTSSAQ
jgi:hypothetical protein